MATLNPENDKATMQGRVIKTNTAGKTCKTMTTALHPSLEVGL